MSSPLSEKLTSVCSTGEFLTINDDEREKMREKKKKRREAEREEEGENNADKAVLYSEDICRVIFTLFLLNKTIY